MSGKAAASAKSREKKAFSTSKYVVQLPPTIPAKAESQTRLNLDQTNKSPTQSTNQASADQVVLLRGGDPRAKTWFSVKRWGEIGGIEGGGGVKPPENKNFEMTLVRDDNSMNFAFLKLN
ncbi:hypothetical protein NBRC116594_14610 [Shimia sp. NS0008-38b]